ncbi:MAG TPA: hypothetical protein VFE78_10170 [Gemmataceae bacterium]|jgi:hypothetical protein|nr:hypothetical protein [Gemmataceae bacterium]
MDILDVLWNVSQEHQLGEVREQIERLNLQRDLDGWDMRRVKELAEENVELKLRLGLLVRLLISKGVINAADYAALIAEARPRR